MKKGMIIMLVLMCFYTDAKEPFDVLNKKCIELETLKTARDYEAVGKYYHPETMKNPSHFKTIKKFIDKHANKRVKRRMTKVLTSTIKESYYETLTKNDTHIFFKISKIININPVFTYEDSDTIRKSYCRFGYDRKTDAWYLLNL